MPDDWPKPITIIAFCAGVALCILALIYGVSVWLVPAIKVAIATFAVGTAVSPFVVQTGATVLIAATSITFVTLTAKAVPRIKQDPFPWTISILALWNPFVADLCKELYPANPYQKIAFKAIMTASFALAAILWKRGGPWIRALAMLLFLFSPVVMAVQSVHLKLQELQLAANPESVFIVLSKIQFLTWLGIALAIILILIAVFVDRVFPEMGG